MFTLKNSGIQADLLAPKKCLKISTLLCAWTKRITINNVPRHLWIGKDVSNIRERSNPVFWLSSQQSPPLSSTQHITTQTTGTNSIKKSFLFQSWLPSLSSGLLKKSMVYAIQIALHCIIYIVCNEFLCHWENMFNSNQIYLPSQIGSYLLIKILIWKNLLSITFMSPLNRICIIFKTKVLKICFMPYPHVL